MPITALGVVGPSAYQAAVANGFVGTEAEWLASLHGPAGTNVYVQPDDPGAVTDGTFWIDTDDTTPDTSLNWGDIAGTLSNQTDLNTALAAKAPLASPTFTGTPTAPTAANGTNTTQVATTAFVATAASGKLDTSAAPELIRDTMGTALVAGANVSITVDDPGDTITIASSGGSSSPLTTKGDLYGYSTTGARVPVGTDGRMLVADSAQTTGLGWAIPQRYADWLIGSYLTPEQGPLVAGSSNAKNLTNNIYFVPVDVPFPVTIDRIGCNVSTASGTAGAVARLGLFTLAFTGNWGTSTIPTTATLVLDYGTVAADSTGIKPITIGTPTALAPGRYWLAVCASATGAAITGFNAARGLGLAEANLNSASVAEIATLVSLGNGATAATSGYASSYSGSLTGDTNYPRLGIRRAS